MTLLATRTRMLGTLLRSADTPRIARLVDRLESADLSRLLLSLNDFELRRAAQVLLDDQRVEATVERLDVRALARLVTAATPDDARRALVVMTPRAAATLLRLVTGTPREHLVGLLTPAYAGEVVRRLPRGLRPRDAHGQESSLGAALRLRRLFA